MKPDPIAAPDSSSPSPIGPTTEVHLLRARTATIPESLMDQVATEEPLEIRVGGRSLAVLMRTPGTDRELAAGFLCTEGLIRSPDRVLDITRCEPGIEGTEPNVINVTLDPDHPLDWGRLQRHTFASSSCGLCGKATIESVRQVFPPVASSLTVHCDRVQDLPERLREAQALFDRTGGLHAAGLFSPDGANQGLFEDVGRHNAVDKLVGHHFLRGALPLSRSILLLSGRVSFEVMQKALAAGIPIVAAISAPTSLAIAFARDNGQTLVGFLRPGRMNIYTHPERITGMPDGRWTK